MRAGLKQRVIAIEALTRTQDATGHPVETWATLRTLRAQKLEGPKVTERYAAQQLAASAIMVFRVGYWPAFNTVTTDRHRVAFEGRTYNIVGTFEIGRKRGVEIVCTGRTDNG